MAEVPSVLFNLERYRALGVAGISIGSNDLTQLCSAPTAIRSWSRRCSTSVTPR